MHGTKMEMTIYEGYEYMFRGLEKQEGKWVEIFRVKVHCAYPSLQATNSRFTLNATRRTQVHIIDPLNNRLNFKNIHEIPHMNHMDGNYLIDTMGVVFNIEVHFDDPARPNMVIYIRDNIESWIKCVATGDYGYSFWDGLENMRGRGQVILVLKMWRVWRFSSNCIKRLLNSCIQVISVLNYGLRLRGRLSYFMFNPLLPHVEEWQSVNNSDPYVRRHMVIGPL
ncbi:unnamed protein product [Brassica rapa subsp. trilocularis]